MPRIINPGTLELGHGTVAAKTVDDNAFKYPERDVDPLRVHLHDPSRAHMAEAIGIVDAADCYHSDEVEGALQEICSGMGAGRMNGLVEGGYIVLPVSPYPNGGAGLLVRLVAPGTGNPSTALINAHTLDISGFEYDFATGVDPVGGAATSVAGTYYLYLETDSAAVAPNAYETLVASTTLPTVASEKIHIAQITHDGVNLTNVVDCRYFVANLDRKLPYTLRSGFPQEFIDEDTDTWGEALFQTLEAALWWIENYDGPGNTQEEKATIIVRGAQTVSQSYTLRSGTCLMGSGPDAKIIWTGQGGTGTFLTLAGDNIRIQDVDLQLDTDVSMTWIALQVDATSYVHSIVVERCNISEVSGSLKWSVAFDNSLSSTTPTFDVDIMDCRITADSVPIRLTSATSVGRASNVRIIRCNIDGNGADYGVQCGDCISTHIEDCYIGGGSKATGTHTGVYWENGGLTLVGSDVSSWRVCVGAIDPTSGSSVSRCNITADSSLLDITGIRIAEVGGAVQGVVIESNYISGAPITPATVTADFEPFAIHIEGDVNGARIIGNRVMGDWYNNNAGNAGGEVLGGALGLLQDPFANPFTPKNSVVTGNVLRPGIVVDVECIGLTISDNIVEIPTNTANGYARDQITIGAGAKDISITGNVLNGNREAVCGIGVFGDFGNSLPTETVTISGNTVRDHEETGILLGGGVVNAIIAGNTIETTFHTDNMPTAYGIWCFGMNPVGAAMAPAITGNTINRMARGIVVEGDQAGLARPDQVTITGNNVNWCATASQNTYNDYDTMAAQGIVVAYARGVNISGNNVAGIGAIPDFANTPIFPVGEVKSVGIQSFRSEEVNIVGNSVGDLYSSGDGANAGWSVGIHVDCFAPQGYAGTKLYRGYGIHSNKVFMPAMSQGNDRRYACIMFWAGDLVSQAGSVDVSQVSITGNTCQGTSGTVGTSGPTGGYFDLIGASSIIYRHQADNPGNTSAVTTKAVVISDNLCSDYGANGISFTTRGELTAGGGAKQIVTADNIRIDGNTIENGGYDLTYVDEQSVTKNGAIVAIAGGSSGIRGLSVSNNSAHDFHQAGVALGVTGETVGDDSEMYDVSVTGNNIQKALAAGSLIESYGVVIEAFDNVQSQCKMGRFLVSDNILGCREEDPADITLDWGFLLKTYYTGNELGCTTGNYQILDNVIQSKFGGIAFDMVARLNTDALTLADVTVGGNQIAVPITATSSTRHSSVFGTANGGLGLATESYSIRKLSVVNNRVRPHPGSASGAGLQDFLPFAVEMKSGFLVTGTDLTLSDLAIRGNYLEPKIGDTTTTAYVPGAITMNIVDSIKAAGIAITDNQLRGRLYIYGHSESGKDVDWMHFRFCDNQVAGSFLGRALELLWDSADDAPADPTIGLVDFQICGNQMMPSGGLTNDLFTVEIAVGGVMMEDWKIEGNTLEMTGTGCGGLRLTATGAGRLQNWSISHNTFKSAEQPFVVIGGHTSSDITTELLRVDDNIMDGIDFAPAGWEPSYYPDAAIIVSGLTQDSQASALAHPGEKQISICRNQIRNIRSKLPDIVDAEDLNIEHSVIYYGPNPYLDWNGGGGAETAQWPKVHGLRIDDNSIHQCENENAIYANFTPVSGDVADISICRNAVGRGTHDGITGEVSVNTGIRLKGRERFEKGASTINGNHLNTAICGNQLYIIGGNDEAAGWEACRGIMIELKSEWYDGSGTYKNKAMKVDSNAISLYWDGESGVSYGINSLLNCGTYGFSCSNNTLTCHNIDGTPGNHLTVGIRVQHTFVQAGVEVKADPENILQPFFGNGTWVLGWVGGSQAPDTTNIWGVAMPNDQEEHLQLIGWRNMSVCGNTVYGNCVSGILSTGLPDEVGALAFFPVNYAGATPFGAFPDTRSMTIMPVIGFAFQNNVTTNHDPGYEDGQMMGRTIGMAINWTAIDAHIAGIHSVEDGTSYLFGGWNISNNASRLYTTTDNALNTGIGPTDPTDIQGRDVYLHQGGYEISGANTGIMRGVICGQNYCAMNDDPGGATGGYRYGWLVQAGGWCPPVGGSLENLNDSPYYIP